MNIADGIIKMLQEQFDKMHGAYEVMSALAEVRKEEIESLQAQLTEKTDLLDATIAGQETLQKALNRRTQPENKEGVNKAQCSEYVTI